jgi:hypothetical protein
VGNAAPACRPLQIEEDLMAFPQGASTAPAPQQASLISDATDVVRRLDQVHSNLVSLAQGLHGPTPRDVNKQPAAPEAEMTLRRALDLQRQMVGMIEDELASISARL